MLERLILRAHERRWRLTWKVILELAGPEADVGTALITCCVCTACEGLAALRRWWCNACREVPGRRQRLTEAEIRCTVTRPNDRLVETETMVPSPTGSEASLACASEVCKVR